jgi:hypothetical protein
LIFVEEMLMQQLSNNIPHDDSTRQNPLDEPPWSPELIEAIEHAGHVWLAHDQEDADLLLRPDTGNLPALWLPLHRLDLLTSELVKPWQTIAVIQRPDDVLGDEFYAGYVRKVQERLQGVIDGPRTLYRVELNEIVPTLAHLWSSPVVQEDRERFQFELVNLQQAGRCEEIKPKRRTRKNTAKTQVSGPERLFPRLDELTYTLRALQTKQIPDLQWAVEDLLPEGLAIIAGPPGLGKSMLLLQLALAVARGSKVLDLWSAAQGEVLYVGTEDNERRMRDRVAQLMAADEPLAAAWPDGFLVAHEIQTFDAGLIEQLDEWLTAHLQAKLVIIDIFADVKPPRTPHSDWYQEERRVGKALDILAMRHHVCVLVSLHTNRLQHAEDPIDRVHGGSGLPGAAPTKTVLLPAEGFNKAIWHTRGRDTPREQHALTMIEGVWTYSGDGRVAQLTEERQAILRHFTLYPGYHTPQQLADALGKGRVTINLLLRKLVSDGFLRKIGYGKYQLGTDPKP